MYTLLNSGDASGLLDNGDFLAGYNRLALIEFNTDFFGKYDTGEDIFKEVTGELDYQYLNLNPLQSVIIFSDKSLIAVILIRTLKKCLQIFMTIYTERQGSLCILLCPVYSMIIMSFHR